MTHTAPAIMHMDGVAWVEKSAYDAAVSALAEKQRSIASHNRYFATIIDMFHNLPASHAQAPYAASADAFRKHALCARGYCDTEVLDMGDHNAAMKTAPFVASLARKAHGYAIVTVRGPLVTCTTPHSQSFKAMGKDAFHESVAACEDWAGEVLGIQSLPVERKAT